MKQIELSLKDKGEIDMKPWLILLIFFTFLLWNINLSAQGKSKKSKTQVIDFEDQLVEGDVSRSELLLLLQKKEYNLGRLLELRENFLPELRRAQQDITSESQQ